MLDSLLHITFYFIDDVVAAILVVFVADFCCDSETGRHRHSQQVHLGQVRTFAAEQVAHRRIAFSFSVAEGVDGFAHGLCYISFS